MNKYQISEIDVVAHFKEVAINNNLERVLSRLREKGETDLTCAGLFHLISTNKEFEHRARVYGEALWIGREMRDLKTLIMTEISRINGCNKEILVSDSDLQRNLNDIVHYYAGEFGFTFLDDMDATISEFLSDKWNH